MKRYLTLLMLPFAALVLPAPAQAAACSGTTGVTVVVQFPDRTQIGCASGDPASGFDALTSAGFTPTHVGGSFGAALCQIDGYPSNPCPRMPPANAYWAYFHAKRGGSWSYSNAGPGSFDPAPGSVEGWRFGGSDAPPTTSPPGVAAPAPKPRPKPTLTPTKKPASTPTVSPTATPAARATASASVAAKPAATENVTTAPPTPTGAVPVRAVGVNEKSVPAASTSSQGSSWIWGVVLIVGLGAAVGATVLRRRRG